LALILAKQSLRNPPTISAENPSLFSRLIVLQTLEGIIFLSNFASVITGFK